MQIISAAPEKVRAFIGGMGDSAGHFRYFSKRPVEVISQHLLTLIGEFPAGNPVAYGHLDPEDGRVWLGICVASQYRGRGFGRQMLDALLRSAVKLNITQIHLAVDRDNVAAIRLYEAVGFSLNEETSSHFIYTYTVQQN